MADRALTSGPAQQTCDTSPVLYDGTQAAGATATALNGGTALSAVEVMVQNDPSSPAAIDVGNATSQNMSLAIGASLVVPVDNVNKVYAKRTGAVDCTVNWWARA